MLKKCFSTLAALLLCSTAARAYELATTSRNTPTVISKTQENNGEKTTVVPKGTRVLVLERTSDGLASIVIPKYNQGPQAVVVRADTLTPSSDEASAVGKLDDPEGAVNLRVEPKVDAPTLDTLSTRPNRLKGAEYQGVFVLADASKAWTKVLTIDGKTGYVRSEAIHVAVLDGVQDDEKRQLVRAAANEKGGRFNPATTGVAVECGLDRFLYDPKTGNIHRAPNLESPTRTGRLGNWALVTCDEYNDFGPVYTGASPILLMERTSQGPPSRGAAGGVNQGPPSRGAEGGVNQGWRKQGSVVAGVLESGSRQLLHLPTEFIERFSLRRHL